MHTTTALVRAQVAAFIIMLLVICASSCRRSLPASRVGDDINQSAEGHPYSVTSRQREPGSAIVDMTLTNKSNKALTIYRAFLPWQTRHSMFILVVSASDPYKPLRMMFAPDDPGLATVTIQPSERVTGQLDLRFRVPDIDERLKQGPLLLFWHYELRDVNRASMGRMYGGCTLRPERQ